jgi:hypothetical protein
VNQRGISQDFWKIANSKANKANADKFSREHLRTKYLWAPNALAVYVPNREVVSLARKIMIKKYGKSDKGEDPVWPDGSSMRFLPIKGAAIKHEKTREIVKKRMAFHIWLKANELTLNTNMQDIDRSSEAFGDKTFAEVVLSLKDDEGNRVFTHFNREWSNDPSKQKWSLSIRTNMLTRAKVILDNIQDTLCALYGDEVNQFFGVVHTPEGWAEVAGRYKQQEQEDDENWFDDEDDIDDMVEKGIIDSSFLQFLSEQVEDDRKSVASWGTGETTYTEIVATQETSNTTTSSITSGGPAFLSTEEQEKRKGIVQVRLLMRGVTDTEVEDILQNKDLTSWHLVGSISLHGMQTKKSF